MSLGPLYVLLGEMSVQVLCPFLIGLFVFLEWSHVNSLYILEIKPLSEVSLANIFFHFDDDFFFFFKRFYLFIFCFAKMLTYLFFNFFKFFIFIVIQLQLSYFPPFTLLHPTHPLPPTFPHYSSCPWVIHISSLASTFPIVFLPSPCFLPTIYATYSLYLSPLSPPPNPLLITLHVISISVVLCFCSSCLLSLLLFWF